MLTDSLEKKILNLLNANKTDTFSKEDHYEYLAIFLSKVVPDDTNPRFFPSIIISDTHAYQFSSRKITKQQLINIYNSKNKILIGKSCIINCFYYGSSVWKKANSTIKSIIELAENIAIMELIQAPTIYPVDDNLYRILTGHRRFFAIIFNNGINSVTYFKVYNSQPLLLKTKQFQENAAREDLSQYGKLKAFQDAQREVEILNNAKQRLGQKLLTVKEMASLLGISMGAFDNYNVLTRYPAVITSFENRNSEPLLAIKKLVLKTEKSYKKKHKTNQLNVHDRKEINSLLEAYFYPEDKSVKQTDLTKSASTMYKFGNIESPFVVETLLTKNICGIECGINWQSIEWRNPEEINKALKILIEHLAKTDPTNK